MDWPHFCHWERSLFVKTTIYLNTGQFQRNHSPHDSSLGLSWVSSKKTSLAQNQTQIQGNDIRSYHAKLYAVLHSFTTAGPQPCNVMLPLGPNGAICIDFITCILFVIQDMQEGDALFGQNGSHTMGIQHYCRACNVSAAQLDLNKYASPVGRATYMV